MSTPLKTNSRRYLSLPKRDTFGLSGLDLVVIKTLGKTALMTAFARKKLKSRKKRAMLGNILKVLLLGVREQMRIENPLPQRQARSARLGLYDYDRSTFSEKFRFRAPEDIERLIICFRIPEKIKIHTYKFTAAEVVLISLARLAYPLRWGDLELLFPGVKRWSAWNKPEKHRGN